MVATMRERNGGMTRPMPGCPAQRGRALPGVRGAGFRHIIYHLAPPYDAETLERFVGEVMPALEA